MAMRHPAHGGAQGLAAQEPKRRFHAKFFVEGLLRIANQHEWNILLVRPDRLSGGVKDDPVVPEGCSIRAGWRSEEGPLQRIWRGSVASVHKPQSPGRRHARDGAWPFWLAACGRPIRPAGRLSDRAVRADQSGEIRDPCL